MILRGAAAPHGLKATISSALSGLDFTLVTVVTLEIIRPDRTTDTWIPTILVQTASELTALYIFAADGLSVYAPGVYEATPFLTLEGDTYDCEPFYFPVT